jgi:hypothetical protein
MKKDLSLNKITTTFQEQIDVLLQNADTPTLEQALLLTIRFFEDYDIIGVDRSIPDYDMLLFQYGLVDLHDAKGENFSVTFTRQFYIEDPNNDEFYQLSITLNYDHHFFEKTDNFNQWSIDFPNITEWINRIKNTKGYQKSHELIAKSYIIELGLT